MAALKPRGCPGIKPLIWVAVVGACLAAWLAIGWIVLTAMVAGGGW